MTHTFCLFGTATKFSREPQCLNWPQNMQALICIYWEKYSYILHWYILQILGSFSYLDLWFLPKKWSYEFSYIYLLHTGPLVCWDSQPSHSFKFLRFCLFSSILIVCISTPHWEVINLYWSLFFHSQLREDILSCSSWEAQSWPQYREGGENESAAVWLPLF